MKFELHNQAEKSPLYYVIRKNRKGHRIFLKYPTGITLTPAQWNAKKQRVREISGIPYGDWNTRLKNTEREAARIFDLNDYFSLTTEIVRERLDVAAGFKEAVNKGEFDGFLKTWIVENEKKKGYHTIKSWTTLKNKLPENLSWESFDYQFYKKFVSDLENKGYTKNYIGKMINNLKIILNYATKEGINKNMEFKNWKVPSEQVYNIYLNEDELMKIYGLKLTGEVDQARDLFLVGCFTGMRVENYLKIDNDINVSNKFISAIVNKGGGRVKIPVHWIIHEIIRKYNGFPESLTQQKLNKLIKHICFLAGIKDKIVTVRTEGGKRVEKVREKWEMATTHTARRSLVTNLYLKNVPLKYIMSITGHKSETQCLNYIKAGIDEFADIVAELDFWVK